MAKTLVVAERDSLAKLRQAAKQSSDEAQKTRIRAIIGLREGKTKSAIAESFAISRTSLISWVALYNQGGTEALELSRGGRPEGNPIWEAKSFNALAKEIGKGGYWSVPRMQAWLKEQEKIDVPRQTIWYRMRHMGYSYKSARPHPEKGNRRTQEAFKKGASRRS